MSDYINFELADFVLDDSFCRWVLRKTPEDTLLWERFLLDYPEKSEMVRQARELVLEVHTAHEYLTDDELRRELGRLSLARKEVAVVPSPERRIGRQWIGVAATLLIGLAGLLFYYMSSDSRNGGQSAYDIRIQNNAGSLKEVVNESHETQVVDLPDGSTITLQSGSRVSFPETFDGPERSVYLSGEAFFTVTKNPDKPFIVYANELVTKVLGTSFTVKAFEKEKQVQVVVKTGRVSVFVVKDTKKSSEQLKASKAELILTPNQQVVFDRGEQRMKRTLIESPLPVNEQDAVVSNFQFEGTPVKRVFEALEKVYEVRITYDADLLAKCELTAELDGEPLFEKLDLICKAIEARYEVIDGQVVVYGKKCQ